ncbi:MAG: hypothetical protein ACRKGH_09580 [Dehalogenimonas sp.]
MITAINDLDNMDAQQKAAFIQAVYQKGFNEGRDVALKATVEIMESLAGGFRPQEVNVNGPSISEQRTMGIHPSGGEVTF